VKNGFLFEKYRTKWEVLFENKANLNGLKTEGHPKVFLINFNKTI